MENDKHYIIYLLITLFFLFIITLTMNKFEEKQIERLQLEKEIEMITKYYSCDNINNQSNQIKPIAIEPLLYERTACIYLGYVDEYNKEGNYFRSEECYMIN